MKFSLSFIFFVLLSHIVKANFAPDTTQVYSNSKRYKSLAVGYRLGLKTGNVESKGIYSNFSFNPIIGNNKLSCYRISFDLKILGLQSQKMSVQRSFSEILTENKKNLYGNDSLYQTAFFSTLDSAGKNTVGNTFISMSLLKPISKVGKKQLFIGLGLGTRSIRSNVSTKFAQDINGEPANFWLRIGRVYMAHLTLEPFERTQSTEKNYWKNVVNRLHFSLSVEYIDYSSLNFDKYNVSKQFTSSKLRFNERVNFFFSIGFTVL